MGSAEGEGLGEPRPISALTAFYLHDLGDQRAAGEIVRHCRSLRLEPQTGAALAIGRDAQIAHKLASHRGISSCATVDAQNGTGPKATKRLTARWSVPGS
jgi:hypothetical protein